MNTQLVNEINSALPHFHGSEQLYEHRTIFGKLLLTDGAAFIREKAQCRWLFDLIFSYQKGEMKSKLFQVWSLERVNDMEFLITCTDGNKNVLARQKVPFSDFPLNSITFWNIDGIVLLPSEY